MALRVFAVLVVRLPASKRFKSRVTRWKPWEPRNPLMFMQYTPFVLSWYVRV